MSNASRDSVYGWGVVRHEPWDFAGLFNSQREAQAEAKSRGLDYAVLYGRMNPDTGKFVSTTEEAQKTPAMAPVANQETAKRNRS